MAKRKAEGANEQKIRSKKQKRPAARGKKNDADANGRHDGPAGDPPEVRDSGACQENGLSEAAEAGGQVIETKEKVLVLCSRGTGARFRHLMLDFVQLLPHCKRDAKLDTKKEREVINEVADMKGCTSAIFFETRKRRDLYMWFAKTPDGPSAKFLVQNIHTMSELRLSGNHLKGSRPVLCFDKSFDEEPHWRVIKEMFKQVFSTPPHHHKSKPFFDHVLNFTIADGRVWMRNYQVVTLLDKDKVILDNISLVEVGPRLCLQPIKMFEGSFSGKTLYHNQDYVAPNKIRRAMDSEAAMKYRVKIAQKKKHRRAVEKNRLPRDELADAFKA